MVEETQAVVDGAGVTTKQATTKTFYDAQGQVKEVRLPKPASATGEASDSASKTFTYDSAGNLKVQNIVGQGTTFFVYDNLNRLTQQIAPDPATGDSVNSAGNVVGLATSYAYDWIGSQTKVIDGTTSANTNTTVTGYDRLNHVTSVKDPEPAGDAISPYTTYGYDLYGNVQKENLRLNPDTYFTTTFIYDRLNRKVREYDENNEVTLTDLYAKNPDGSLKLDQKNSDGSLKWKYTGYTYDFAGNMLTLKDASDNVTTFTYDTHDRLLTEKNALGKTQTSTYDSVGRLWQLQDRKGRVRQFQYDNLDRQVSEQWLDASAVNGVSRTIVTTYDTAGNVHSQSDPDSTRTYTYDARGRLLTDSNAGTPGVPTLLLTYGYNDLDNVTSRTQTINGVLAISESYTYDHDNRLIDQSQFGSGLADKKVHYTYNTIGQFATITTSMNPAGSLTAQTVSTATYTYDNPHRLTKLEHTFGTTTLAKYEGQKGKARKGSGLIALEGQTLEKRPDPFLASPFWLLSCFLWSGIGTVVS